MPEITIPYKPRYGRMVFHLWPLFIGMRVASRWWTFRNHQNNPLLYSERYDRATVWYRVGRFRLTGRPRRA